MDRIGCGRNCDIIVLFSGLLQLALDLHYTEDEIYELSLAREPRNSLSAVSRACVGMEFIPEMCFVLSDV